MTTILTLVSRGAAGKGFVRRLIKSMNRTAGRAYSFTGAKDCRVANNPLQTTKPDGSEAEDAELLGRAQAGDRNAFGAVVERHRERLFRAALLIVRDPEDARDLSQEAFVRAFRHLARFDSTRPFYPWLYRILRNLCLDQVDKNRRRATLSLDRILEEAPGAASMERDATRSGPPPDARERIQAQQMSRHLHAAIEELKPEFREVIFMQHFQEMSYQDIADALEIPIGTVMSRLFHARKKLAEIMRPHRDT